MRKNKIAVLALVPMLAMSVSCSRIGKPSDDAITTDIKARMFSEPALKAATVDVVSKQGEVTLTGQVPDDAARLAAYKIASETKGVSRVNDQMSVAAAQMTAPQPAAPTPEAVTTTRTARSKTNQAGQVFKASLDAPIVVDNRVIVPSGADAYVKLVSASSAGHITGRSELGLELSSIVFQGKTYNVASSDVKQSGASRGKRSAETIGGGAALGALIGAVAGGGKGAAIGAAVGG